jgi:hypothetical protein
MGAGSSALGKKIENDFKVFGQGVEQVWGKVKDFGNTVWNGIKSVPVIGDIAGFVEKYTPIGLAATNIAKAVDSGITGGAKLFQGDIKGAANAALDFATTRAGKIGNIAKGIKEVVG